MARKKSTPIEGLPKDPAEKLTVQKSNPLYSLWKSDMTLAEFKILDTYLSRINSRKPEQRLVHFQKGEIEQILGVKKINNADLEERLKHSMGNVVKVDDKDMKKGFRLVTLFETAEAEQDDDGIWRISLECTQKAMKYFFNVEHLGYMRYKLRSVTCIKSRYSYIIFNYLEKHRHMGLVWTENLDTLKQILNCDKEELYIEYKRFNERILKRCHKELMEKTECHFDYEPVKKNRRVVAIKFTLEPLVEEQEKLPEEIQITLEEYLEQQENKTDRVREYWESAVEEYHFTDDEIAALRSRLESIPEEKLPVVEEGSPKDVRWYHLMQQLKTKMKSMGKVNAPYKYLLRMLENEDKERKGASQQTSRPAKKNAFNDFDQREIDFDEVEAMVFNHQNKEDE